MVERISLPAKSWIGRSPIKVELLNLRYGTAEESAAGITSQTIENWCPRYGLHRIHLVVTGHGNVVMT